MSVQRVTITIPSRIADRLRREAKATKRPMSRLVAEALERQEEERLRQRMADGYKAMAEEDERLAEEWLPLSLETWPRD